MPNTKISALTQTDPAMGDLIPIARGSSNFSVTPEEVARINSRVLHVNDFGAVGDGASHPLSTRYASLAAAQVDYPCAVALTDEIDWCAWQTVIDTAYQRDYSALSNRSTAYIVADGRYVINRTINCYLFQVDITGCGQPGNVDLAQTVTSIRYNGAAGTVDDPAFMFDFNAGDEHGDPPPGIPATTGGSAGYCRIRNMGFVGKYANSVGMPGEPGDTDYVVAIRMRYTNFCEIARCSFYNSLFDGIRVGLSMFSTIRNNFFYGCQRDALSYYAIKGNFSTTIWIDDNEFGYVGRYAICVDVSGSIQPSITARRNDIECTYDSYYVSHPEWFVHGVVAPMCVIGAASPTCRFEDNRFEGVQFYEGIWADWHFAACGQMVLDNNMNFGTVFTTHANSKIRTDGGITFFNEREYFDITDTRNYLIGYTGDALSANNAHTIRNSFGGLFIFADGVGFGSSSTTVIENQTLFPISVPVIDRPDMDGKMLGTPTDTVPTILTLANYILRNVYVSGGVTRIGTGRFANYASSEATGDYTMSAIAFNQWSASQACRADCDTNGGGGAIANWIERRKWVVPTTYNGFFYECTQTGTTGGSEPTWPTTVGNTVTDGGVIWECVAQYGLAGPWTPREQMKNLGQRHILVNGSAPSTGRWLQGDTAIERLPAAAGFMGYVCVTTGIPGTWKTFGAISA